MKHWLDQWVLLWHCMVSSLLLLPSFALRAAVTIAAPRLICFLSSKREVITLPFLRFLFFIHSAGSLECRGDHQNGSIIINHVANLFFYSGGIRLFCGQKIVFMTSDNTKYSARLQSDKLPYCFFKMAVLSVIGGYLFSCNMRSPYSVNVGRHWTLLQEYSAAEAVIHGCIFTWQHYITV